MKKKPDRRSKKGRKYEKPQLKKHGALSAEVAVAYR